MEQAPARRTSAEWKRLIKAWKRSGATATEFGEPRGLRPGALHWWNWWLSKKEAKRARRGIRLVRVRVKPSPPVVDGSGAEAGWELRTVGGDVLHVQGEMTTDHLLYVLDAMRSPRR